MGLLKSPRRRKYACSECTTRPSSMVALAAFSACPSTCPPNTWALPVSRLWPRNRLTSSLSSSNCCCRSARRLSITGHLSAELEDTLHDGRVPREAAEEGVRFARLERRGRELDAGGLSTADHLGVRNHAGITLLDVIVRQTGSHAIAGNAGGVGGLRQHPVVAHALRGHFARMLQSDFDLRAIRRDGDFLLVELHRVVAGNLHRAHLVGGEGVAGYGEQRTQGQGSDDCLHDVLQRVMANAARPAVSASPGSWWCTAGTASWTGKGSVGWRRPRERPRGTRTESASSYPDRC